MTAGNGAPRTPRRRRRVQIGPGRLTGWSPSVSASSRDEDDFWLEREVDQIVSALKDNGEQRRRDLATLVGSKYWGPGRFRHALSAALARGKIRRPARGRYAAADEADSTDKD